MRVVILEDWNQAFETAEPIARLRERAEVVVYTDMAGSPEETYRRAAGAQVVVGNRERTRFDAAFFEALPDLKLIAQTGGGLMHVDLPAATRHGVLVCVTTGGSHASMVEFTLGMMIAGVRRFAEQDRTLRSGQWWLGVGQVLEGKTLGVVGLGRLGSRVAKVAQALGMRVLASGISLTPERAQAAGVEYRELEALFAESDLITIHLILSERTRGLIAARHLGLMKPNGFLINTSRGPIVDEGALVGALRSRRIAGAALDVYDQEPLPSNHPLLGCDNALLTAHCGWVTDVTYQGFTAGIAADIEAWLDGQPINVANPEAVRGLNVTPYVRG